MTKVSVQTGARRNGEQENSQASEGGPEARVQTEANHLQDRSQATNIETKYVAFSSLNIYVRLMHEPYTCTTFRAVRCTHHSLEDGEQR